MTIKYHPNGLWFEKTGEADYRVGVSEKGQDDVGEVMFAELSAATGQLLKGEAIVNVEGAKAVTELTAPFDFHVKAVHEEIEDSPELLNSTDKKDNWLLEITDFSEEEFSSLKDEAFKE
ncbi:MAG: glycine cleavage system protein H [Alkalibacterium sp.]|nr:glycine cleavage system protein H [Alkalibacterium sp.]